MRARDSMSKIISALAVKRVAAKAHRHGARMARLALDCRVEPRRAIDRGHDADRQGSRSPAPALARYAVRRRRRHCVARNFITASGSQPNVLSASRIRHAVGVLLIERRAAANSPGESARTGKRRRKSHALLIAESDDLDRMIEPLAAGRATPRRRRARPGRRDCRRSGRRCARYRYASRASARARPLRLPS